MTPRKPAKRAGVVLSSAKPIALISDVRELILQAREGVARAVDSGLTTLYWHVDRRIRQDILKETRAEYGGEIVSAPSAQLEAEFGLGFGEKNLRRMVRFAERLPDGRIVTALLRQLSWIHFVSIVYLDDPLKCVTVQRRVTEAVT